MATSRKRRAHPGPDPGTLPNARSRTLRAWRQRRADRDRDRAGSGTGPEGSAASDAADNQEKLIADALSALRHMDVREVMTPRVDVVALTIPVYAHDVARAVRESGHSCFPVVDGDLDDLVGVLFVNDLFRTGRRRDDGEAADAGPLDISRRIRQPWVVPETLGVLEALAELRRQRRAFAMVVDEYGGVAGVLTVKDLLEPLVGDLHDEFDTDGEPAFVRVDGRRWLVDGRASIDDVRERLGADVRPGDYVTLGGYLFDVLGHIPDEGERVTAGQWELRVVEMDRRRIAKVVARNLGESPSSDDQSAAGGSPRIPATPAPAGSPTPAAGPTSAPGAPSAKAAPSAPPADPARHADPAPPPTV